MTKFYSWAKGSDGVTTGSAISLVAGEHHHDGSRPARVRGSLMGKIHAVRANLAGLPIYLRFGTAEYEYKTRAALREVLDEFEARAKLGRMGMEINSLLSMSIRAKRRGKIVVSPKFFPTLRRKLESEEKHCANYDKAPPQKPRLPRAQAMMADRVVSECCRLSGCDQETLLQHHAKCGVRTWRSLTYWLLANLIPEAAQTTLARHVGKDHATFLHGVGKVDASASLTKQAKALASEIGPFVRGD